MDEPPASYIDLQIFNAALSTSDSLTILFYLLTISVFVILSAAFSGSENALFSLSKAQLQELIDIPGPRANAINFLLRYPKRLLATILIANTFVNIAIVLISTLLFASVFNFAQYPLLGFFVEVVLVTFMLVLFGEVIPKVYSFQNNVKISRILAVPLFYTYKLFQPLVLLLEKSTSIIDKRITKKGHIFSVDELTHAIEITSEKDAPKQEKNILKSDPNVSAALREPGVKHLQSARAGVGDGWSDRRRLVPASCKPEHERQQQQDAEDGPGAEAAHAERSTPKAPIFATTSVARSRKAVALDVSMGSSEYQARSNHESWALTASTSSGGAPR